MIVALHGFTGSPQSWSPLGLTGPAILGHASEAMGVGSETFPGEVKRLAGLLPDTPVHLVGYSLGGRLALALALAYPARIARLSLIGAHPGLPSEDERRERRESDARWIALLRQGGIEAFVDAWQALPLWESQNALPQRAKDEQRAQRLQHDPEQLAHAMAALGTGAMPPMWNALGRVHCPVDLIAGAHDAKYRRICEEMGERLPRARFTTIADAGHNPVLENPQALQSVIHGHHE